MPRVVKKAADRKAEIVSAARCLFQTQEYDHTSMQDIMDALDIAKGTIYHYFKSKEALLEAVVEDIVDTNIKQMEALLKNARGNALKKMELLVKGNNIAADNKDILDHLHKPGNAAMHTRLLAVTLLKLAPLYAEVIQQGCDEGIFKSETPLECAEFILSGAQFLTDMGIYAWAQEDLERRIRALPKLIERQLQAPSGSFQFLIESIQMPYKSERPQGGP